MKNPKTKVVFAVLLAVANIASADIFDEGGANEFTIDFVDISGDASSANGTYIGADKPEGFIDPTNDYRMGTYEITNDQWNKFTNIYGTPTGSPSNAYDESAYWTGTNVPTNRVSWNEAAQFVNYLNTSTGHQAAYKFTGTQGTSNYTYAVWESGDAGYDSTNPYRNSYAHYFMPTEDEWVKAAYWNGTSLQTWTTIDDSIPTAGVETNYQLAVGLPWDVGSGSEELNGTYDMMGNLWEWMENPFYSGDFVPGSERVFRGGSCWNTGDYLTSSVRFTGNGPYYEYGSTGFRVASVPEPATILLLGLGGLTIRRRK